jgi:1-acyl-sn-glycerol-3-phosphate acyltransferase
LIFPEGRYSSGSALRPLKTGIGHFALHAGVPICPVTVRGTDSLRPFRRIDVTIGPPIEPDPPAWWALSSRVTKIVDNVRVALLKGLRRRRPSEPSP